MGSPSHRPLRGYLGRCPRHLVEQSGRSSRPVPRPIPNSAQVHIANVDAGESAINITEPIQITPEEATRPKYELWLTDPTERPVPGGELTYRLRFCATAPVGNTDLVDVEAFSSFTPGTEIVDSGSGVQSGTKIVWNFPKIDVSELEGWTDSGELCLLDETYTIRLPADSFPVGKRFGNTSKVFGEVPGISRFARADSQIDVVEKPITTTTTTTPTTSTTTSTTSTTTPTALAAPEYRVGNLVWNDLDNDGVAEVDEPGIAGVTVELYQDDDGVAGPSEGDTRVGSTVTDADGHYLFDGLDAGDYYANIAGGQDALEDWTSSDNGEEADADSDGDNNDNGAVTEQGDIVSSVFTLGPDGSEPTGETLRDNDPTGDETGNDTDNQSNLTIDFGFYELRLGNRVWFDTDNDGTLDPNESGIGGVRVDLWVDEDEDGIADDMNGDGVIDDSDQVGSTVTDTDGYYLFTGLGEGTYLVSVPSAEFAPDALLVHMVSSEGHTGDSADLNDNGIDPATPTETVWSGPITLRAGAASTGEDATNDPDTPDSSADLTVDFGFHSLSLGNRVWLDTVDTNGKMDAGEPGVGGVSVQLVDPDTGAVLDDTLTDSEGYYLFVGLEDGHEYLVRIPADNFADGGPLEGYLSTEGNGETPPDPDDDVDTDDNGAGKPGKNVDSAPVTLTAAGEPTGESDIDPDGVNAADDANSNLTVDFGFVATPSLSLGNRVWFDADNSATRDDSELGASGVTVELFRDTDSDGIADSEFPFQSTVTDGDGYYLFGGLAEGDYLVRIPDSQFIEDGPLQGWHSSTGAGDADDDNDVDDNGIDGDTNGGVWSGPVTLSFFDEPTDEPDKPEEGLEFDVPSDENANMTVDFGFYRLALGDEVWFDADNDGLRDADEDPIADVLVELWVDLDGDGEPDELVASTTTDGDGLYHFSGLAEGDYLVSIPTLAWETDGALVGLASSDGDADPNSDVDDDDKGIDPETPGDAVWSDPITLSGGDEPGDPSLDGDTETNLTVDFGFRPLAGLDNKVWLDSNRNGLQDEGEESVPGVKVELLDPDGKAISFTVTDEDGMYWFLDLDPGEYQVRFDRETLPAQHKVMGQDVGSDDVADSDGDPETGLTHIVSLEGGDLDSSVDLGIVPFESKLELKKTTGTDRVAAGEDIAWFITGTNSGSDPLLGGFSVMERLPKGLTVESWTGEGWECAFADAGATKTTCADSTVTSRPVKSLRC